MADQIEPDDEVSESELDSVQGAGAAGNESFALVADQESSRRFMADEAETAALIGDQTQA